MLCLIAEGGGGGMGKPRQRNLFVKNASLTQEGLLKSAVTDKMGGGGWKLWRGDTHTHTHSNIPSE